MAILRMTDLDLRDKRVLIREDLNVPVQDGVVTSDARIRASLPTIQHARDAGARVLVMSHLGRPEEGVYDEEFSLAPVAKRLAELLGFKVRLEKDWLGGVEAAAGRSRAAGKRALQQRREEGQGRSLEASMAELCDIYVMDAFGTAHRAEASTHGVARFAKVACAGPLLMNELIALETALDKPKRPLIAIVAGSKVSTKLTVLESLLSKVDKLIVGGGIANTFLLAEGIGVGKSLVEAEMIDIARGLLEKSAEIKVEIPLPTDVVVAKEFAASAEADVKAVGNVAADEMILDIGPDTADRFARMLSDAGTIVWNGPVGVFEFDQFGEGTRTLAQAIARSSGVLDRRRRRHAGGDREIPRRGRHLVHLHRRRRFPRVPRGQEVAGRCSAGRAGEELTMLRRTKILTTLGPATDNPKVLADMLRAGADVVRVNFSHGEPQAHAKRVQMVRSVAEQVGKWVAVLGDLQGPKIRIERFADGKVVLNEGDAFALDVSLDAARGQPIRRGCRLQEPAEGRACRRYAAAQRRSDGAGRHRRERSAHRHARRDRRRAFGQQGHQQAGRRPVGRRADRQGSHRHQARGAARRRLSGRLVRARRFRTWTRPASCCARKAGTASWSRKSSAAKRS